MQLSTIFSDGMVLQRNKPIEIKGYSQGNQVTVVFAGKVYKTDMLTNSYFELTLPCMEAGGPYEMVLYDGEKTIISDILIGDVFVLGGQSNMELPIERTMDVSAKDVENVNYPNIRMFQVPKEYNFCKKEKILSEGSWIKLDSKSVLHCSALGYFLADTLYKNYEIPIGLIHTAVGGTPIEAWLSEDTLLEMGICKEALERNKDTDWVNSVIASDKERIENWHDTMRKNDVGIQSRWHAKDNLTFEKKCMIHGRWDNTALEGYKGSVWLRKEIEVPSEWINEEVLLRLGAIEDGDETYVNGVLVGVTTYRYPPRNYYLPPGLLSAGKNIITIRMFADAQPGGFMPGKKYGLEWKDEFISLEGEWQYEIGAPMPPLEPPTFFEYEPSGVFNKIIAPLEGLRICAVVFYQGESNTSSPQGYAYKLEKMIEEWRRIFKDENLPFVYIGLAFFTNGEEKDMDENWMELRSEQIKALKVKETAMVDALDLGEYNDLHPQNKKELGKRVSYAIKKLVYKEKIGKEVFMQQKVRLHDSGYNE